MKVIPLQTQRIDDHRRVSIENIQSHHNRETPLTPETPYRRIERNDLQETVKFELFDLEDRWILVQSWNNLFTLKF